MQTGRLAQIAENIQWPDGDAERETRHRLGVLDVPQDGLGRLADIAVWAAGVQGQCPPQPVLVPRLVLIGGDHGVAARDTPAHHISARRPGRTAADLAAASRSAGISGVLATVTGVRLAAVDVSTAEGVPDPGVESRHIRAASAPIDTADAMTAEELDAALQVGVELVEAQIAAGCDLIVLGDVGIGSTTAAAALICLITGSEPVHVIGRGSGIDDETWMRKLVALRDARRRGLPHRADPSELLRVIGGPDLAAATAVLLHAATRKVPVLIDGVVGAACALVAREQAPRGIRWWRAAHTSPDAGHVIALERLRLEPVLDLGINLGGGAGALLAVPVVQAAVRLATYLAVDPAKLAAAGDPSQLADFPREFDAESLREIDEPVEDGERVQLEFGTDEPDADTDTADTDTADTDTADTDRTEPADAVPDKPYRPGHAAPEDPVDGTGTEGPPAWR